MFQVALSDGSTRSKCFGKTGRCVDQKFVNLVFSWEPDFVLPLKRHDIFGVFEPSFSPFQDMGELGGAHVDQWMLTSGRFGQSQGV